MRSHIGPRGLALLKQWEGLRFKAYQDSGGVWTIGYGHTLNVRPGDELVDIAAAEQLLHIDLVAPIALFATNDALTDGQFDALVCFAFNVGNAAYLESTLRTLIDERRWFEAPREMLRWHFDDGKRIRGLLSRRIAEAALFCEDRFK